MIFKIEYTDFNIILIFEYCNHIEIYFKHYMYTISMANTISLPVRLPIGVYNEIKKLVDEDKIATSYGGYCRQIITADVMKRMERNE